MRRCNDHGWGRSVGETSNGQSVFVAPVIGPHLRCDCKLNADGIPVICVRQATQEDLLCDECREDCR